ncbi:DUF2199 domain-containing protein [Shewanella sp. KX20019]|uniref:DUF2199 domain-containing protein n=1 Tax=Shewanella sp. KX20019 TaxID=2803864 RepID=UPI0019272190|nr:DUF2199 domain-containing protein [Shewanella sp. KX20019]QQX81035.1 DUF2199 domain-containing protein [Shewanella sp. KX20019]
MAGIFSFKCSSCDKIHEGSPSFGFNAPDPYLDQSEDVKEQGKLTEDLCFYTDEDGTHYFVRAVMEISIDGVSEPFTWGVWSSLSKSSYDRYVETYDNPDLKDCFFGYLSNYLPYYKNTYALKLEVQPQENNQRPQLVPHESEHQLVIDFKNGINISRAQEIAEKCMHS